MELFETQKRTISFVVEAKPQSRGSKVARIIYAGKRGYHPRQAVGAVTNVRSVLHTIHGCKVMVCKAGIPMIAMDDSNKDSKSFMKLVELQAGCAYFGKQLEGAVNLKCVFVFERPKGHFGTGKNAGIVKDRFVGAHHTVKPDLSKLIRPVEDAITYSGLWKDDNQVVSYEGSKKIYGDKARVEIEILPLENFDQAKLEPVEKPF